jgi:hypothetical protein
MPRGRPKKDSVKSIDQVEQIESVDLEIPLLTDTAQILKNVRKSKLREFISTPISREEYLQSYIQKFKPFTNSKGEIINPKLDKEDKVFFAGNENIALWAAKNIDTPLSVFEELISIINTKPKSSYSFKNDLLEALVCNSNVPINLIRNNCDHPCYDIRYIMAQRRDLTFGELEKLANFELQKLLGGNDGYSHGDFGPTSYYQYIRPLALNPKSVHNSTVCYG